MDGTGGVVGANMGVSAAAAAAAAAAAVAHAAAANSAFVNDVHANGGDIDSLLSNDPDVGDKSRRLLEPYERHRAHDLRAECYRRGIRPIKKGPNANDNKNGYILLLRKYDGTATSASANGGGNGGGGNSGGGVMSMRDDDFDKRPHEDDDDDAAGDSSEDQLPSLVKKRKLPSAQQQGNSGTSTPTSGATGGNPSAGGNAGDLSSFYESAQSTLVPVLPMQYPNIVKPTNPTTDLEILSGIANTYTQNTVGDGQLCGTCRTVVTDQLMESIRLGKNKMQLQEYHKLMDQRDRDTIHLKEVLSVLADLRKAYREAQSDGINHDLLVELEDDIAFFQVLKERTKERMRLAMQETRERAANKSNSSSS
ncbi:hypothetical protein FI667_g13843, partial [Globisporangium splendens]